MGPTGKGSVFFKLEPNRWQTVRNPPLDGRGHLSWRLTPPMPPRTNGARPAPATGRVSCHRMEQLQELLAFVESCDNGKPIRETNAKKSARPLIISAISPAASALRKAPCRRSTRTRCQSFPRAARRRRPDHPVEFSAPDGRLETRPSLGRPGTGVVLKPAEQTPMGVLVLIHPSAQGRPWASVRPA